LLVLRLAAVAYSLLRRDVFEDDYLAFATPNIVWFSGALGGTAGAVLGLAALMLLAIDEQLFLARFKWRFAAVAGLEEGFAEIDQEADAFTPDSESA